MNGFDRRRVPSLTQALIGSQNSYSASYNSTPNINLKNRCEFDNGYYGLHNNCDYLAKNDILCCNTASVEAAYSGNYEDILKKLERNICEKMENHLDEFYQKINNRIKNLKEKIDKSGEIIENMTNIIENILEDIEEKEYEELQRKRLIEKQKITFSWKRGESLNTNNKYKSIFFH